MCIVRKNSEGRSVFKKNNYNKQNQLRNYKYLISKGIPEKLIKDLLLYNIKFNKNITQPQKTLLIMCNCNIHQDLLDKIATFYINHNKNKILDIKGIRPQSIIIKKKQEIDNTDPF